MLGQSFLPGGDDQQRVQQQEGQGPVNPVQEAIKVLSLKLPRFLGNAPAPAQLLTSMGGAGLPNPLIPIILQQLMPPGMGRPSAPTAPPAAPFMPPQAAPPQAAPPPFMPAPQPQGPFGQQGPSQSGPSQSVPQAPPESAFKPRIEYMPGNGTAAGTPMPQPRYNESDLPEPFQAGAGRRVFSK